MVANGRFLLDFASNLDNPARFGLRSISFAVQEKPLGIGAIHEEEAMIVSSANITLDPRIFPLDTVIAACYQLSPELLIRLEGDPMESIVVKVESLNYGPSVVDIANMLNQALVDARLNDYRIKVKKDIRDYFAQMAFSFG